MHLEITAAGGTFASLSRFIRPQVMAIMALASLCFICFARAGSVYHNADDGAGFSGFAANTNWTPGTVPGPGNDFFVVNFTLRSGAGTGTFLGDSLSFVDGGRFYLVNNASTDIITVNNLNLDAGEVRSFSGTTGGAASNLAGNIRITSNGAIFYQSNTTNDYLNIQGSIFDATGSPGGPVALGGNDSIGGAATNKKITLSGTNTYTGPTLLLGGNVQLASPGALSPSTKLIFGSGNTANSNGNATLDLNGGSYSVNGIAVQSYTAQVNQPVTLPYPNPNPSGIPTSNNRNFHLTNPIVPGSIQIGQTVTEVLSTGTAAAPTMVIGVDYTTNDVILGDNTAFNNTTANVTGLTFNATQPLATGQTIGNSSTTSDATLSISGTSSFAGNIVDSVLADPAVATSGGTKKTNIAFTAPNGTLTLSGANTYTGTTSLPIATSTLNLDYATARSYSGAITGLGAVTKSSAGTLTLAGANTYSGTTTVNGGSLLLDFSAAGAPTSNIINNTSNNSSLVLNGTNLTLKGGATAANSQQFSGFTLGPGSSSIVLTSNATPQPLALNVGGITRSAGGFLLLTNPSGTISATNGLLTSSGSAGALVTSNGTPYIVVNGTDWAAKDASNQFVTAIASYTPTTATTLSGNADVVTDVALAAGGSASSIRFNNATPRTVTVTGTLTDGGVLMTAAAGNGTITGGSVKTTGAGAELTLVQNSTSNTLTIGSNIVDNSGSGLATAGPGNIVLSGQNSYTGKTSVGSGTVQFTKENSLYNNTPASWTASNIGVNGGATLGLNVGGSGEFTASDVATLSALGTTTGGLRNGSTLALDTTNAAGGVFALTSPITNTNSGANLINLNKIGVNTLQLAAGPNTYTGTTTVSKGTLQLTGNNSLTGNTVVTLANDATATFDLNGNNTTIGGLTGGGTTGGKVSLGTGNLTVVSPSNATYAGSFTSAGGGVNFNLGALGSNAVTQTLTGGGSTAGNLTVANGTVVLAPAAATTWGSASSNMVIAPGNGSSSVLTVGANANVVSQYIMVGGDPATDAFNNFNNFNGGSGLSTGGIGTFNVNASSSHVTAQTLYIGTMARVSAATTTTVNIGSTSPDASPIVELTGTVIPAYGISGAGGDQSGKSFAITMATNQNDNGVLNIAGANTQVKIENGSSIIMGRFYAQTATITQSGGNVTFYSDAGTTVGGTGALIFDTDNPTGNAQNFRYNLNGGTLTVPQVLNANAFSLATTANPTAALVLNGGTLAAAAHAGDFIGDFITGTANGYAAPPAVRIGTNGGTIETNGATVQINAGIFHDPNAAAVDGGLTIKSSVPGGVLVLNPSFTNANTAAGAQISANTFNGPVNIVSGTLQTQKVGALAGSSLLTVGANGKFDVSVMPGAPSLPAKLTLSGTGHVVGSFFHTTPTSVITGGGVGTVGTLTFDNTLDLAGGVLRADLDQTATSYDKIVVSQNGGFGASGSPGGSVVDIEFTGTLPTVKTTYSIVNYSGNFNGPTNNVTFNGSSIVNPSNLVFTSSNSNIAGRNTQLSVNNTTHTLDVIYQPGATAGDLIWTGGTAHNSSVWDTNNTANWNNVAASINPDKFFIRDKVTFDNSAGVPHAITVNETIAPQTLTVNSDGAANSFSFSGTGKISGVGSLTKSGTSTLTLSTSNDYSGGTTINAGTVIAADTGSTAGVSSALGSGPITIASGALLQVGNGTAGAGTITSGVTITNNGSLVVNRPDSSTLNGPIVGAGTLAIQGGGIVSLRSNGVANASTYSGNTTISGGSTLQLAEASATSPSSVINVDNTAGSRFTLNGFDSVIAGLSGGGANSGDVTIGGNNFTFAGIGTNNLTFSGPMSSLAGTIFMGRTQAVNDEGNPTTSRTVALTSKDAVQTLAGAGLNLQGPTTVRVGTLNYAPTIPTTIGGTGRAINITAPITLPFGVGTSTPPNQAPPPIDQVTQATLSINANTTLLASTITLNPGQNSLSNFIQNGGTVQANGLVQMGNSAGGSTITLNGGTFLGGGATAVVANSSPSSVASLQMGINGGQQAGAPPLTRPYEFNVVNVNNGATMKLVNDLSMGLFFNSPCTVNQNGGTIQFVDASLNPGGTGGWICVNNNNANFGRYVWNLNGGLLSMNQATILLSADANPNNSINLAPVLNLNGGTVQALSDQPVAMFDFRYNLVAQANGGTFDTNSHNVNFTAPIIHANTLGSTPDGGVSVVDSVGGGSLTYSVANTYTGPTKIGTGAKLILNLANAMPSTSAVNLAGGTLNTSGFDQNMSASTKLKVSGNSTLDLATGGSVQFADSTLSHWATGTKLTISNLSGGHILVGANSTSLTPNQLSQVQFAGSPVGGVLTSFGELRPGTAGGTIEKLGDVDHNGTTNAADITALTSALTNLTAYTNNLTLDPGWTSKSSQALYLADVNFDDQINNLDLQALINYLKGGGTGSNALGGGSVAPVPEPSTWLLLALGGLIVGGRRFCRKS